MNMYAKSAIKAFEYMKNGFEKEEAWKKAVCEFTKSIESQKKPCPKNAFFGLVGAADTKNALYARKALDILRSNPNHNYSIDELWPLVVDGPKRHDSQMDVVLALWNNGSIR